MNATADPTMDLFHALNRADPSEWSKISYGMPIFIEHEGWEVPAEEEGKKKLVVVPKGERPPANGKKVYEVDKSRLAEIAREINRQYETSGTPVKLFIGHSDPKKPQAEQPPLVGFGRGAYLGRFGPKGRLAIKTDAFYKPGYEQVEAEYPERSPEFLPRTNGITGVALLKTDPRLKMGMMAYEHEGHEVIYYGVGLMNEITNKQPDDDEDDDDGDDHDDDDEEEKIVDMAEKETSPATPAKAAPPEDDDDDEDDDGEDEDHNAKKPKPFEPHEQKFAERLMSHLEKTHPAIKYLCGEHTKYMSTQTAMAKPKASMPGAASATSGYTPKSGGNDKSKSKKKPNPEKHVSIHMSTDIAADDKERIDYAEMQKEIAELKAARAADQERVAKLEEENAILYATEAIDTLEKQGKVIKDKPKEIAKLVKMKTLEERQEYLKDIRVNYADAERSPARGRSSWLPIDDGNTHVEGAEREEIVKMPSTQEILQYAEENKIDASTEEGMRQVVLALTKQKKSA